MSKSFFLRRMSGPVLPVLLVLILAACLPATPTLEAVANTLEPGAPLAFESPYPPPPTDNPPAYPPPGGGPATPTPEIFQPPACQFPGGPPPDASGPSLEDYVFSEPQVVLTHTDGIDIAGWLPDNQRLLITRHLLDQPRKTIETYNFQTGEAVFYGTQAQSGFNDYTPIWLEGEQAVVYVDRETDGTIVLRKILSPGQSPIDLVTNLNDFYVAASTDEQQLVYFTATNKERADFWNLVTDQPQGMEISLPPSPGPETGQFSNIYFRSAWSPDNSRIAFYRNPDFILVDPSTGNICKVALQMWTTFAHWSSDGRFLAMITTTSINAPFQGTHLVVLDIVTGETRILQIEPDIDPGGPGGYYVTDIAWIPNTYHLLVLRRTRYEQGHGFDSLFLIDAISEEYRPLFPNEEYHGIPGVALSVSPDGSQVVVWCPTEPDWTIIPLTSEFRLCSFSIEELP